MDAADMSERQVKAMRKAIAAIKDGSLELDDTVHELKSVEATEINNNGVSAQLDYIIARAGVSFLEDIVG